MPAVRLIVTMNAATGRGADLAAAMQPRLEEVRKESGCEQYDLFQNTDRPDVLVLLERWSDEAAFEAHLVLNGTRPAVAAELRVPPRTLERYSVTE